MQVNFHHQATKSKHTFNTNHHHSFRPDILQSLLISCLKSLTNTISAKLSSLNCYLMRVNSPSSPCIVKYVCVNINYMTYENVSIQKLEEIKDKFSKPVHYDKLRILDDGLHSLIMDARSRGNAEIDEGELEKYREGCANLFVNIVSDIHPFVISRDKGSDSLNEELSPYLGFIRGGGAISMLMGEMWNTGLHGINTDLPPIIERKGVVHIGNVHSPWESGTVSTDIITPNPGNVDGVDAGYDIWRSRTKHEYHVGSNGKTILKYDNSEHTHMSKPGAHDLQDVCSGMANMLYAEYEGRSLSLAKRAFFTRKNIK